MSQPACSACSTPVPEGAEACPACGGRPASSKLRATAVMSAVSPADVAAAMAKSAAPDPDADDPSLSSASRRAAAHPSQTDDTLFNLSDAARAAVEAARKVEEERIATEAAARRAAEEATRRAAEEVAERERRKKERAARVWPSVVRAVMVSGGLVLMVLFGLATPLIGALGGVQLVLAFYYLVGGLVLALSALLPLPARLRAVLSTLVGAVPLFVAGPLVGDLGGWRGLAAALVILVLPGALLLRARVTGSRMARALVAMAVVLSLLVYVVPADGLVPLKAAARLVGSGDLTGLLTGLFFVAPLGLVLLTLTAFAGDGSTGFGNLWACLVLLIAAGAVMLEGQIRGEVSLTHLGIGLLAAGSAAAVGVADLLHLDPI